MNHFETLLDKEIKYSTKQMNNILDYINRNKNKYKENTNVFAYYIITNILLFHHKKTIQYFEKNNTFFLKFNSTFQGQMLFCEFIKHIYLDTSFISFTNKHTFKEINDSLKMTIVC